jgi:maltose-binding protein MalE
MLFSSLSFAETIEIRFWEQSPAEVGEEMDKWIAVFAKRNPNVKIVRQHYENEELRTKFLRSAITGDGADLVSGPNDLAGVLATAGVIHPVDDLVKKHDFADEAVAAVTLNNHVWGVPLIQGNHLLLYYNKKFVKEAPESTKKLLEIAKKHTNKDRGEYGLTMFQSEPFWFVPILAAFDGWPLDTSGDQVKVTIDTKETRQALQYLVDLKDKHGVLPKDCDYDCAKTVFLAGRSPFHINGDWEIKNLREQLANNLGVAPLPVLSETGNRMVPFLGGRFLFINRTTEGKKLAAVKEFIDFLVGKQVQIRIATKLTNIPALSEVKSDPRMKSLPDVTALIESTKYGKAMPSQVEMRATWEGMRIMVQRAMSGKESVDQAVKTGQKAADEALAALRDTAKKTN